MFLMKRASVRRKNESRLYRRLSRKHKALSLFIRGLFLETKVLILIKQIERHLFPISGFYH